MKSEYFMPLPSIRGQGISKFLGKATFEKARIGEVKSSASNQSAKTAI
jgi:hypothetical protein